LAGVALVAFATGQAQLQADKKKPHEISAHSSSSVEDWLKLLASDDFNTREAATATLAKREDLFRSLHQGLDSPDAEVRRRVQSILAEHRRTLQRRAIERIPALAKNREVFRYVDQMISLSSGVSDAEWKSGLDTAKAMWSQAVASQKVDIDFPDKPFLSYKILARDIGKKDEFLTEELRVLATKIEFPKEFTDGMILCRDSVSAAWLFSDCIIFANGNVMTSKDHGELSRCLVCCDGDIEAWAASRSVLIATGSIRIHRHTLNCVVLEKQLGLSDLIRQFDLSQVGLRVCSSPSGIAVLDAHEAKCFSKAGIRSGDLILQVAGEKTRTVEALCRQVRKNALESQITPVTVKRGDEVIVLLVQISD
jgi:hypothetical protein